MYLVKDVWDSFNACKEHSLDSKLQINSYNQIVELQT